MNNQDELLAWAEEQAHYEKGYSMKRYNPCVCHQMNLLDKRVREKCCCQWVAPYGFVPEAGCPRHDN